MNKARELLIEAALSPHRPPGSDGQVRFHPAFFDLDAAGRVELFAQGLRQRQLETTAARDGLSATARAVMRRIRSAGN